MNKYDRWSVGIFLAIAIVGSVRAPVAWAQGGGGAPAGTPPRLAMTPGAALTPSPGTLVHPGDTVTLVFTIPGGGTSEGAIFSAEGGIEMKEGPGPYSLKFVVPNDRVGRLEIHAATYGKNRVKAEAGTWLQVAPAAAPARVEAVPPDLQFNREGVKAEVGLFGHSAGGARIDMSSPTAGTIYAVESRTGKVVTVSPEGLVTSVGGGTDAIIITNGAQRVRVPVTVRITNRPPSMHAPPQVTLVAASVLDVPVTATDPEGQQMKMEASDLPKFATFTDAGGGRGTIHLAPSPADVGTFEVYVTAVDTGAPPFGAGATVKVVVTRGGASR